VNLWSGPSPIDQALLFCQSRRIRGLRVVLRLLTRDARHELIDDGDEQLRAQIGRVTFANIAPASSSLTTRMMVTPVWLSPLMTARCTGAAPRYFGRRDA